MARITLWQNMPTMYQASVISKMAERWSGEVVVVLEEELDQDRIEQGWYQPDYSPADEIVNPTENTRTQLLEQSQSPEDIHIFSGFYVFSHIYETLKKARNTNAQLGIYVEPRRTDDGLKAVMRRLLNTAYALRWRSRLDFLLVTGELGEQYFTKCGFPPEMIVPYGYFPESTEDPNKGTDPGSPEILFVGEISRRKGIDVLINSVKLVETDDWELALIGEGDIKTQLQRETTELNDNISWLSNIPNEEVQTRMRQAAVVVLPSRYDGWGVVVNEALLAGTPVITTTACGAADLIQHPKLGTVIPPADTKALSNAIDHHLQAPDHRNDIQEWARTSIVPDVVASYLTTVFESLEESNYPDPPWRSPGKLQ